MSGRQQFPPVGDPARLDAILDHGRTLRRRRRAALTTGAGAVVLVVVFGVVFATATSSNDENVFAGQDDESATVTTGSTTTTTVAPAGMTVTIDSEASPIQIVVHDPATPVAGPDSAPAQQCVLLTLTNPAGDAVAEGYECATVPEAQVGTPVDVNLRPLVDQTQVGCAAVVIRGEKLSTETTDTSSTFNLVVGDDLPVGEYDLKVDAVSGIGDGCGSPTSPGSTEFEDAATASAPLMLP